MYSYKKKNLPKNAVEILVSVPWKDVEKEYEKAFEDLRKELKIEGFRKGKAPKEIAEKNLDKNKVYDKFLRYYLPSTYSEIIKKEDLKPITSPKIELVHGEEKKDWEIKITVALYPEVKLGDYKEAVKKAKAKVKKSDIWVPGKDEKKDKDSAEKQKQAEFQAAFDAIISSAEVEIADILVEEEADLRLSKLVDDIQKVGLTMDSYLKSKNLTKEQLQEGIRKEIEDTYKAEFILQKIADEENIKVDQKDLDKVLSGVKDEKAKQQAAQNMYQYASIMRKQKVLDYINSL